MAGEEWMPQYISPGRDARVGLIIWIYDYDMICWNGPIVNCNINAEKYIEKLESSLLQSND